MVQYSQSYSEKEGNFSIIEFAPSKETPLNDQLVDYQTMQVIMMTGFALVICLSMSASLTFRLQCFTLNFVCVLSLSVRHVYFTMYTFIDT